jgi:hypothetical protein
MHNLIDLGLRFEFHVPENVVDQMNDSDIPSRIQHEPLLRASDNLPLISRSSSSLAEYLNNLKINAVSQVGATRNAKRKLYYLHIDVSIEPFKFVQCLFAGGMPYLHLYSEST